MNRRRIYSRFVEYGLYFVIAMNLEIFKIFGDTWPLGNPNRYGILTILFSLITIVVILGTKKRIPVFIQIICLGIFARIVYAIWNCKVPGYTKLDALQFCKNYLYVFASMPLYYLIKIKPGKLNRVLKNIFILTMISHIIKTFVSIIYFISGYIIFPAIAYHESWIRYGFLRMVPPMTANIIIPIAFYLYLEEKSQRKRIWYIISIIYSILFSAIIYASRFMTVCQLAILIYLIMIERRSSIKKLIAISVFIFMALLFLQSGFFDRVISTFDVNNSTYGGSTIARLTGFQYYISRLMENPIWGIGIIGSGYSYKNWIVIDGWRIGDLTDVGFLFTAVQYGLIIIIFEIILIVRLIILAIRTRKKNMDSLSMLLWGISLSLLICNLVIDTFYLYAITVPLSMALVSYTYDLLNRNNQQNILKIYCNFYT